MAQGTACMFCMFLYNSLFIVSWQKPMDLKWLGYRVSPFKESLRENNGTQVFPQAPDPNPQTTVIAVCV